MVREATLDGQPVALVDGPPPHVLLSRAGRSILTLDVVMPLAASGGAESIALPASPSPISRVRLDAAEERRRSVAGRRLPRRSCGDGDRKPMDGVRPPEPAADDVVEAKGGRSAQPSSRCACARGSRKSSGSARTSCQVAAAVRVEVLQGLAREVSRRDSAGLVVNQVNGATVADWDDQRRPVAASGCSSRRPPRSRSSSRATRGRRATARSTCRSCGCRRPSAKPAASPWTSPAPARSASGRRADSSRPIRPSSAISWPAANRRR